MVRLLLLDINQHENKWCCTAETPAGFYRCKIQSALDDALPHFAWYRKRPRIYELRSFVCHIYPITPIYNKLYKITHH